MSKYNKDPLESLENLLWHAEWLEELIESERGKGRSSEQLYAAGEMHEYMVEAKSCIEKLKAETSEVGISLEEVLANAYEWGYGDGQNSPNGYSCEDDRNKCVAEQLELLEGIDACAESKSRARSAE